MATTKTKRGNILIIGVVGGIFIILISVIGALCVNLAPVFTLVLYAGLIVVTMLYVYYSMEIADATRQQASASVKMAEEAREQRIMSSRPVIIQRAVPSSIITSGINSDNFEIYNSGSGPAIELEIILFDKDKKELQKERKTFLRADEPPITFYPRDLVSHVNSNCYLLCKYQDVISHDKKKGQYETSLPFKPVKSQRGDYVYIEPGELQFREVSKKRSSKT